jgi:hypothetical protein
MKMLDFYFFFKNGRLFAANENEMARHFMRFVEGKIMEI